MRIVDITEFFSERGGGVRSHLYLKSQILSQLGHEHHVVAPGPEDALSNWTTTTDTYQKAKLRRLKGPHLPYDPTYHLFWRLDKLQKYIFQLKPDVLEIHSPYLAAVGAHLVPKRDRGILTFTWHSDFIDTYIEPAVCQKLSKTNLPSLWKRRLAWAITEPLWAYIRAVTQSCDATFATSQTQMNKLKMHGLNNVHLTPFGVQKNIFFPYSSNDTDKKKWLQKELMRRNKKAAEELTDSEPTLFLCAGRLASEKKTNFILDVFFKTVSSWMAQKEKGKKPLLIVAGDGPERKRLEAQAVLRDDVIFWGFETHRETMAKLMRSCDVFIHACPYETFGLSVAEALACGMHAILPDKGGASEFSHFENVLTYPSLDLEAACQKAMKKLNERDEDPLHYMAVGIKNAALVPDTRAHFTHLLELYSRALEKVNRAS